MIRPQEGHRSCERPTTLTEPKTAPSPKQHESARTHSENRRATSAHTNSKKTPPTQEIHRRNSHFSPTEHSIGIHPPVRTSRSLQHPIQYTVRAIHVAVCHNTPACVRRRQLWRRNLLVHPAERLSGRARIKHKPDRAESGSNPRRGRSRRPPSGHRAKGVRLLRKRKGSVRQRAAPPGLRLLLPADRKGRGLDIDSDREGSRGWTGSSCWRAGRDEWQYGKTGSRRCHSVCAGCSLASARSERLSRLMVTGAFGAFPRWVAGYSRFRGHVYSALLCIGEVLCLAELF